MITYISDQKSKTYTRAHNFKQNNGKGANRIFSITNRPTSSTSVFSIFPRTLPRGGQPDILFEWPLRNSAYSPVTFKYTSWVTVLWIPPGGRFYGIVLSKNVIKWETWGPSDTSRQHYLSIWNSNKSLN